MVSLCNLGTCSEFVQERVGCPEHFALSVWQMIKRTPSSTTARSQLQKLDTNYSLNPMIKEESINFTTLHLEGVAHEWWYHGLVTQGHDSISTI